MTEPSQTHNQQYDNNGKSWYVRLDDNKGYKHILSIA